MLVNLLTENLTTFLMLGIGVLFAWFITRRQHGIPPGPWPVWPLLGNVVSVGSQPVKRFEEWRKRYGDIFSFYVGHKLIIVLNGFDVLKEALVKHGEEFTGRPDLHMIKMLANGIGGTSGKVWKEQRRFALSTLRDFGLGRNILEEKINEESVVFLKALEDKMEQKIEFTNLVKTATANIICSIVFGKRFEYNDPIFVKYLQKVEESLQASGLVAVLSFFPLARYIPGDLFNLNKTQRNMDYTDNFFLKPAIEQHIKDYDENNINDLISAYIKEIRIRETLKEESSFSYDSLLRVAGDLFVGGTETTATTLRWAVLHLMRNPNIQEKCYQEIQEIIGTEKQPRMTDKIKMPYMEAAITELQRLADIIPFSFFRTVPYDVCLNGHTIPKGAIVIPNLSSVHKDPKVFENPDEFKPERFLDSNGSFVKPEEVIPFAMGKRNCIGESLARMEIFLFLTAMIQRFRFEQPEDEEPPSLEAVSGSTASPKPYKFLAVRRLANE